jgi:chromate transporter
MRDAPWRKTLQRALVPITVGFIVSGGYVLATPTGVDWRSALIAGSAAAILYLSKLNPLWILAGGGVLGAFLF